MRKLLSIIFLTVVSINFLHSQNSSITGFVKDKNGLGLVGITITEKGTGISTSTAGDGKFSLSVKSVPTTLFLSGIGFKKKELLVDNNNPLTIILQSDDAEIDEVVIIGHQKQSMKKTTSSVQVISGSVIENLAAPSFESLLQGRVSGVNIQSFTGEPGARNTFTIRGNSTISQDLTTEVDLANTMSSPLYIIDGMPMSVNDLASSSATGSNYVAGININDIESITVQKDAAATAVWGSRGANGVIVIKTKVGKSGRPQIRASYYKGITQRPSLEHTFLGSAERQEKLRIIQEYANTAQLGIIPQSLTDSLNSSFNNATDWQDLFYTYGNIDNVDLSIAGGSEFVNYRLSLGYYDEGGIVRNTGFKRYSLRGNFGIKLTSALRTDFVVSASRIDRKVGMGRGYFELTPISPTSMPSSFVGLAQEDYDFYLGSYDKSYDDNKTDILNLFSKTYLDILPGLQYSFEASVQANLDSRNRFQPREITPDGRNFGEVKSADSYTYNLANVLNYTRSFGNHNFILTGLQSFQYDNFKSSSILAYNLPTDDLRAIRGVSNRDLTVSTNVLNSGLLSYSGQFAYDFKSKYIFNASFRGDGSSRFGKDSKWGYFPSLSLAWIVSDEEFFQNLSFVDFFKLRGSWGKSGVLPADFYAPFNVWDLSTTTYDGQGIATPSFTKPLTLDNLTWNKSEQTNIGFDLNLFSNRIAVVFDAYRKINTNPIVSFPFPFYTGYTRLSYNIPMSIYNEGIDLTINSKNMPSSHSFQWNTNLNLSFNKNRIGSLPNGNSSFYQASNGGQSLLFSVGGPIYQWAQMVYQGVYNRLEDIPVNPVTGQRLTYFKGNNTVLPGMPLWLDANGDWDVWSDSDLGAADGDLVPTGDPNPKLTGGLYNEFSYKNFSLGLLATFTLGRDVINTLKSNQLTNIAGNRYNFANNRLPDFKGLDYWTPEKAQDPNYQANFPSINPLGGYFNQYLPFSTMWNEKGDYFRLRTLTLGYLMPSSVLNKMNFGLKSVRFYGMVDNLFLIQSSNLPDAELVTPQGEYIGGTYPLPKKFTIGVEVNF